MNKLREILKKNSYSIIASNDYHSCDRGIKPVLLPICENKDFFKGLDIADRVIGKASAMLLIYSGVKSVDALLISKSAMKILDDHKIPYTYESECEYIINRTGDDMCPMEKIVKDIDNPYMGYLKLKEKVLKG